MIRLWIGKHSIDLRGEDAAIILLLEDLRFARTAAVQLMVTDPPARIESPAGYVACKIRT